MLLLFATNFTCTGIPRISDLNIACREAVYLFEYLGSMQYEVYVIAAQCINNQTNQARHKTFLILLAHFYKFDMFTLSLEQ